MMDKSEFLKNFELLSKEYKSAFSVLNDKVVTLGQNYRQGILHEVQLVDHTIEQLSLIKRTSESINSLLNEVDFINQQCKDMYDFDTIIDSIRSMIQMESEISKYQVFLNLHSDADEAEVLLRKAKLRLVTLLDDVSEGKRGFEEVSAYRRFVEVVDAVQAGTIEMMECMRAVSELTPVLGEKLVGHALFNRNIKIQQDANEPVQNPPEYNEFGYDQNGYNQYGFDMNGYDKFGFDIYGYDSEGYDILGYDVAGFNRDGICLTGEIQDRFIEGYSIDSGRDSRGYDKDGFNESGINRDGFDRDGYDAYGYDKDGCNRQGFKFDGYDRFGYDINGFSKTGYDRAGYNRFGYNKQGFDRDGYNKDGFDYQGFNKAGFDKDGYDNEGYDIDGYDRNGNLCPDTARIIEESGDDDHENKLEQQYYSKCVPHINKDFRQYITKREMEQLPVLSTEDYVDVYDKEGFWVGRRPTSTGKYSSYEKLKRSAEERIERIVKQALDVPYYAHVSYKDDAELYFGKQAIPGWVTDWADERSKYYYERDTLAGIPSVGLDYVRDIIIKDRKYKGFTVLYDRKGTGDNEELTVTDSRLVQIIEANRKNKNTHDIIASIQKKQYEIITGNKDKSYLVNGCAGSGKTMILMHRIRYMKYNNPDLKMSDIYVLSPTNILGRESKELSKILQIDSVKQYNTKSFYQAVLKAYLKRSHTNYKDFVITDEKSVTSENYKKSIDMKVEIFCSKNTTNPHASHFYDKEVDKIAVSRQSFLNTLECDEERLNYLADCYEQSLEEHRCYSEEQVQKVISNIEHEIFINKGAEQFLDFIETLVSQNIFKEVENQDISFNEMFVKTKAFFELIIPTEMHTVIEYMKTNKYDSVKIVQLMNLYIHDQPDEKTLFEVLDEWRKYSIYQVQQFIRAMQIRLQDVEKLKNKRTILRKLVFENWFCESGDENSSLDPYQVFEKLTTLYAHTEVILQKKKGVTPLQYFAAYESFRERVVLFESQIQQRNKGSKAYLFYTMLGLLDIDIDVEMEITSIPVSKAFVMVKAFYYMYGSLSKKRKYFFIDEYQDYALEELDLISKLFSDSIFNLYGDPNQCINKIGIHDKDRLPKKFYDSSYEIKENYRNAKEISDYVKSNLKIDNMSIGLSGLIAYPKGFPNLVINEDDRIAVIVHDDWKDFAAIPNQYETNDFVKTNEIKRGCLNIIPVSDVKGLEFEKVILIPKNMSKNQKYVSCTRAISELYIMESRNFTDYKKNVVFTKAGKNVTDYRWIVYQDSLKKHVGYTIEDQLVLFVGGVRTVIIINREDSEKIIYIGTKSYWQVKRAIDNIHSIENATF